MSNRLQIGIDFSHKRADLGLFTPGGQPIVSHQAFANSAPGYTMAKELVLETLQAGQFDGLDVSGEATGYYWLPLFLRLAQDPDLAPFDLHLYPLNARWVRGFKKAYARDDKVDEKDPFYIAERSRLIRPPLPWSPQLDFMPLRFYTRLRFHLVQNLAREKNFFCAYLFLKASAYNQVQPFADTFGVTSGLVLSEHPSLDQLANVPVEELASYLHELSNHRLRDPRENADKLRRVAQESFGLPEALLEPVHYILELTLAHIRYLEAQIQQVEDRITAAAQPHPEVAMLDSIPGIGPVISSGIVAEIGDINLFLAPPKWDKRLRAFRPRNLRDAEDAVAKFAGLWWPRNSSGDFEGEDRDMAKAGNRYLRYYFIQGTDCMRHHIPDCAEYYARKHREALKHKHHRALVLTARRSIGLFVGLLHRNEAYRRPER